MQSKVVHVPGVPAVTKPVVVTPAKPGRVIIDMSEDQAKIVHMLVGSIQMLNPPRLLMNDLYESMGPVVQGTLKRDSMSVEIEGVRYKLAPFVVEFVPV